MGLLAKSSLEEFSKFMCANYDGLSWKFLLFRTYSFGYVAGWSRGKELAELKASLDTIRATAAELIDGRLGPYRAGLRSAPAHG